MIKIFVIVLLLISVFNIVKRPIIPIFGYYLNSILSPKHVWFWAFDGIPTSFILTVSTILSCAIVILRDPTRLRIMRDPQNIGLLCLWVLIYLADLLASYPVIGLARDLVLTTLNTLMIVYFASVICIKSEQDIHILSLSMLISVIYYTYWANMSYITGEMWLYATTGRLRGPQGSIYTDENSFAMLFVVGMPFVFFLALSQQKTLLKWLLLGAIPAMWHAIFLCGSRGALIGTTAATLACVYFARSKKLSILVISILFLAIIVQGGALLTRTKDTVQRDDAPAEEAIDPRIYSWQAGARMIADHPFFGIGTERFQSAYSDYQEGKIHVAHNTFVQIAANNGLPAGLIYLGLFYGAWRYHRKNEKNRLPHSKFTYLENAITCSMIGFFVCSIFLDLLISELLYFLLLMHMARKIIHTNKLEENQAQCDPKV